MCQDYLIRTCFYGKADRLPDGGLLKIKAMSGMGIF